MNGRDMEAACASQPVVTCEAPYTTLHLDPRGVARVCCENKLHALGRIQDRTLREIWAGAELALLRDRLSAGDFSLGCQGCGELIAAGDRRSARASLYDYGASHCTDRPLLVRLELELSNRCNLQCVMCNGELSSAIRAQRDRRPPLPMVYGDPFFDELAELAPQLEYVSLLGGEPFLAAETLRALEVLGSNRFTGKCHVTTNGTIVNDRVASFLNTLDVDVAVSVDGITASTVEKIRRGARFDQLMENIRWFRRMCSERGTNLTLHYCLMRSNWFELRPFLEFADELDADTAVLHIEHPVSMSMRRLQTEVLEGIVEDMVAQDDDRPELQRNRDNWHRSVERLRRHAAESKSRVHSPAPVELGGQDVILADLGAWADEQGVHRLSVDSSETIVHISPDPRDVLSMDLSESIGSHIRVLLESLSNAFGRFAGTSSCLPEPGVEDRLLRFEHSRGEVVVRAVMTEHHDGSATWHLAVRTDQDV